MSGGRDNIQRLSQSAQAKLGLPEGFQVYSPFPFGGMNYQASRIAIGDQEWRWRENFIRVGEGNLRTTWDVGPNLYKNSGTPAIVYFFWYNIGPTNYVTIFFSDGTAVQVNGTTGFVTPISSAIGTFYVSGGSLPACVSWGSQYLLISNNNTFNDYWIWDGTVLYTAGGAGPVVNITSGGVNYSSLPTVTAFGGQGAGITAVPTILNGSVNTVRISIPGFGYVPGDTVQLQFSGGGSDTGAVLLADIGSGGVGSVEITAAGTGYTSATVTFSAPTGLTAAGTAVLTGSNVTSVSMTNPGGGYTVAPTVSFSGGGGSAAAGYAVLSGGSVVAVVITNQGHGYTSAPTVSFTAPTGAVTATGTATTDGSAVTVITITNPGAGYTSAPTVTIGGPGSGATATAFLSAGGVVGVTVVDGGTGYTFPPGITFQGGNGTGASGVTVLTATSIDHIDVTSGGGPYSSVPTVVFNNTGTSGSGATATAVIADGKVVSINLTAPGSGYKLPPLITFTGGGLPSGDPSATAEAKLVGTSIASVLMTTQGSNYTQAPAVIIAPGENKAASAILEMMPFGVSGNNIESYQQRVWVSFPKPRTSPTLTGNVFDVTAPQSVSDFATSDGGVVYKSNSPVLRAAYTALKTVGDFLYPIGDSSVDVISNVQTSGNPPSTTFNYNNADPQIGTAWRDTIRDYGRTALFGNAIGIYGLYGGAVTKLSDKLDDLFQNAIFPPTEGAITPSAAVAEIYKRKVYLFLMTVTDPFTLAPRNVMVAWDGSGGEGKPPEWFVVTQTTMPTFLNTRVVDGVPTAWGTDGSALFPLLGAPSSSLTKTLSTKLYGANSFPTIKQSMSVHLMAEDLSSGNTGIRMTGSIDTENGSFALANAMNFGAGANSTPLIAFNPEAVEGDMYGAFLGMTLNSTSSDFTLKHFALGYRLIWGGFGAINNLGALLEK